MEARVAQLEQQIEALTATCAAYRKEMEELATKRDAALVLLKHDHLLKLGDDAVRAHTGLPSDGLRTLFALLEDCNFEEALGCFKLPWRDCVTMTLFWLTTASSFRHLQVMFGRKSISSVHDIIHATLPLLAKTLRFFFINPAVRPKEKVLHFPGDAESAHVAFVADCFVLQVGRPHHPELDAALSSPFIAGHHGKFMLACGTDGYVAFVSRAYAGTMSDETIASDSGFYDLIQRGDTVLYNKTATTKMLQEVEKRGGCLHDAVSLHNGYLPLADIDRSWSLLRARLIIESNNKRRKRFRILQQVFPQSVFPIVDDIVTVCCLLTSLMGPVRIRATREQLAATTTTGSPPIEDVDAADAGAPLNDEEDEEDSVDEWADPQDGTDDDEYVETDEDEGEENEEDEEDEE